MASVARTNDLAEPVSQAARVARTLILIPAYNEEVPLPQVLRELKTTAPEHDVLVVVDGSTDATAAVARASGVRVAELPFNLGIGAALRTGFQYAQRHDYDVVIQFDADGQHDPAEIQTLLDAVASGAEIVIGSRFRKDAPEYDIGLVRGRAMGLLRLALQLLSGRRFSDTSSGFRAFDRRAIAFFAASYPAEYMESVEALLLACYEGLDVVEVPAAMRHRAGGTASTRDFRLIYHYLRLLLTMLTSASISGRRGSGR